MFSIPGPAIRTCEGLSRRDWLRVGSLGTLGLTLPRLLEARTSGTNAPLRSESFGRAKSCIILFMFGAPAHQDIWDLKPHAPAEVRGEFQPIATNVPGITVCEHIPLLSQRVDRFAQIRSMTHPDDTHTVAMHYMLTGVRHARPKTNPRNAPDDFPCFGAVANYVCRHNSELSSSDSGRRQIQAALGGSYASVSLNAPANQVSANNHIFPGFFSGFLGSTYDPLFVSQHANSADFRPLPIVDSAERLSKRRDLLACVDRQTRLMERSAEAASLDRYVDRAVRLLTSAECQKAFRIQDEPQPLRERYGSTPFGSGCLLARRLVEAGVPLVTVNWERDDAYWDTHADNFNQHKKLLLPNLDRGFSALLDDLESRGLMDETLIVWLAEFGRTPKINSAAGRDHWAACNTVLLAGAGIEGGQIYGASDRHAAYPISNPVGPEDLAATIYHLLGIDPHTTLYTPLGQPHRLSQGEPISALL